MKDDLQLIDETLAGRSESFGELVVRHQDRLYSTLVHVTGSTADAEDVVQDAFVQAYRKLPTFQKTSAFYTWLYRIAFNLAMSRKRRRRPELSVDEHREQGGPEPVDRHEGAAEQVERSEGVQRIQAAIARLSEEHRTILLLREMEGCCYETIAEMLQLPVGTVRSRIHRARSQLREMLKEDLQET